METKSSKLESSCVEIVHDGESATIVPPKPSQIRDEFRGEVVDTYIDPQNRFTAVVKGCFGEQWTPSCGDVIQIRRSEQKCQEAKKIDEFF